MDKFKEEIIFQMEKDNPFEGFRRFRETCIKKYDYSPSTDLCIRINNYQVETYGSILNHSRSTFRVKHNKIDSHARLMRKINSSDRYDTNKFIERVSQNG